MSQSGGSSSTKKKAGSHTRSRGEGRHTMREGLSEDHPLYEGAVHADNVMERIRQEVQERKAQKKDRKIYCGRCGKHKDEGARLSMCAKCRSINYCSAECQKDHWRSGHKDDCSSFKYPPFTKTFNPSERHDVPWPVDPVFAHGTVDGLGVWLTPSGDLSPLLQQAYDPPDEAFKNRDTAFGPPSYQRWAKVGPKAGPNPRAAGPEMKKYVGGTLLCVRIVVQNRRKDDKVVLVNGYGAMITVSAAMYDTLLPEDKARVIRTKHSGVDVITVPPWVDYNGQTRVAIREINGFEVPLGSFIKDGEYVPPPRPSPNTEPWGRVLHWDEPTVLLAPGEYVVFRAQYRLGDGNMWLDYPNIMTRLLHVAVQAMVLQPKLRSAPTAQWIMEAKLASIRSSARNVTMIMGPADHNYVDEYYRPFFEKDADVWAEERLGGRAREANGMIEKFAPQMMKMLMGSISPEKRVEMEQKLRDLGFDPERMFAEGD